MIVKKLKYRAELLVSNAKNYLDSWGIGLSYILFVFLAFFIIILLSYNIYKTINKAELNYKIKMEEERQAEELAEEAANLDEQIEYLESIDATRNMAVSGYRLADPGEELYIIETDDIVYDYIEEENKDPINMDDDVFWWKVVVGI